MIATMRMMGDPMNRWQKYGPEAAQALAKAKALDANNPRTYLLEGQDKYYTPEQFGGSKTEAKKLFEKAKELYTTVKPASEIHPHWGMGQTMYFLSL
jgi:CHASE3 domain sensor protein